ncbi:MAG: hypothetical protein A2161_12995 [Candidatus Schekmanbacteria bacterium RBG_13_48_7]|uniref:Uncharacterized protein n=1 Tax=Candidatus Schekmanbacteria bacterium RBG_13_48_7 TaxID=1817878 RepID=A0A1F7RUV6_9BACT|nr:MAG: hypothetical protein A2161_12995 [Candidatus Schekmanbacteria bacterium RBG_13_48_7]
MILMGLHLIGFSELEKLQSEDLLIRNRYNEIKSRLTDVLKGSTREFINREEDFIYYSFRSVQEALEVAVELQKEFDLLNLGKKEEKKVPILVAIHDTADTEPENGHQAIIQTNIEILTRILKNSEPGEILLTEIVKTVIESSIDCIPKTIIGVPESENVAQVYRIDWQNEPIPTAFIPEEYSEDENEEEESQKDFETQLIDSSRDIEKHKKNITEESAIEDEIISESEISEEEMQFIPEENAASDNVSDDLQIGSIIDYDEKARQSKFPVQFPSDQVELPSEPTYADSKIPIDSEDQVLESMSFKINVKKENEDSSEYEAIEDSEQEAKNYIPAEIMEEEPAETKSMNTVTDHSLPAIDYEREDSYLYNLSEADSSSSWKKLLIILFFIIIGLGAAGYYFHTKGQLTRLTSLFNFIKKQGSTLTGSMPTQAPTKAPIITRTPTSNKPKSDIPAIRPTTMPTPRSGTQDVSARSTPVSSPDRKPRPDPTQLPYSSSDLRDGGTNDQKTAKTSGKPKTDTLLETKSLITAAQSAIETGDWNHAYLELSNLSKKIDNNPVLDYMMGSVALKLGEPNSKSGNINTGRLNQAQVHFHKVLESISKSGSSKNINVIDFGAMGKEFLDIRPVDLYKILAKINIWKKEYVQAYDFYRSVLEKNIKDPDALQGISGLNKLISEQLRTNLTRKYMQLFEKDANQLNNSQKDAIGLILYSLMEIGD